MSQTKKIFGGLIQTPNMSKHTTRNKGATIKASRKTAYNKDFFILGQKKVIALNLYVGANVLVYERWLVLKVYYTAGRWAYDRNRYSFLGRVET